MVKNMEKGLNILKMVLFIYEGDFENGVFEGIGKYIW